MEKARLHLPSAPFLGAFLLAGLLSGGAALAAGPAFPASGLDAQSLGRGGTVIAVPGTFETVLGNPACLFPTKAFSLSFNYVNPREGDGYYSLGATDGRGGFRAAFAYLEEGGSFGFPGKVWGAALAQTLGSAVTIGESFHSGKWGTTGKTLESADLGVAFSPMGRVILGYVARGFYRNDKAAMERRDAYGVRITLPWTLELSAELEESPAVTGEKDLRAGVEGTPWEWLTLRAGVSQPRVAPGETATRYTAGASYRDQNGTIDIGVEYDPDSKKTEKAIFAISMKL